MNIKHWFHFTMYAASLQIILVYAALFFLLFFFVHTEAPCLWFTLIVSLLYTHASAVLGLNGNILCEIVLPSSLTLYLSLWWIQFLSLSFICLFFVFFIMKLLFVKLCIVLLAHLFWYCLAVLRYVRCFKRIWICAIQISFWPIWWNNWWFFFIYRASCGNPVQFMGC